MRRLQLGFVLGACLVACGTATAAIPLAPAFRPFDLATYARDDWATNGGDYAQDRYSTLSQIDTSNVASLKAMWHIHLNGSGTASKYKGEATPLVYRGIMYVVTGNSDVFALDATSGAILWEHVSRLPQSMSTVCCGWASRGLALGDGKVFVAQLDGTLVALDQQTGGVAWAVTNARWEDGYTMTMAPLYYDGLVIVGVSGAEFGARGSVTAYAAADGRLVWRFYTTPSPGELGAGTWPDNSEWMHGGATVWSQPSVDATTGLLYISTGNAGPWSSRGPGDNLFTSSMVALDAKSGRYRWHFQMVHHDIWDYDCPSNTVLFDATIGGVSIPVVAEPCKTGWVYELNRANGSPAIGIEEKPVPQSAFQNTSATQPIPVGDAFSAQCPDQKIWPARGPDGNRYLFGCIFTPYDDRQFTVVAPGALGGNNWNPVSYDPNTGYLYVCSRSGGSSAVALKGIANASSAYVSGQSFTGINFGVASQRTAAGDFTAMRTSTNTRAWSQHFTVPPPVATNTQTSAGCDSGSVATAGNLVFMGLPEGMFHGLAAYNAATGAELWRFQTDAGIEAPPITYGVRGKQYVAVLAAGRTTTVAPAVKGDSVYAFTLDGAIPSGG